MYWNEVIFLFASLSFLKIKIHFIMSLLFLEMMSLSIYFLMMKSLENLTMILFLSMMVMEGAFGLSMVISKSRKSGGEYLFVL